MMNNNNNNNNNKKKTSFLLRLLLLLFFLSCLGNLSAVPLSRSLQLLENQEPTVLMGADQMVPRQMRMMEEQIAEMDIEKDDYPGSGPNDRHDPKAPGTRA